MADVSLSSKQKNFRSVGTRPVGHVSKGTLANPTSPRAHQTSVPTIPSKFETILHTGIQEHDGFMSRVHRFDYGENENPGPGTYVNHEGFVRQSDSLSKKGYGNGFASKSSRFMRQFSERHQLAPGSYHKDYSSFKQPEPYHKGLSSAFSTPSVKPQRKEVQPGPGEYDIIVPKDVASDRRQTGHSSVFKAPDRFKRIELSNMPAPGQYEPSYKPVKNELMANPHQSVFESRTVRSTALDPRNIDVPGPGSYAVEPDRELAVTVSNPYTKVKKGTMLSHSQGRVQRPSQPGPGQYLTQDKWDKIPRGGVQSSFVSSAPRLAVLERLDNGAPGPGAYDVARTTTHKPRSFRSTADGRWTS